MVASKTTVFPFTGFNIKVRETLAQWFLLAIGFVKTPLKSRSRYERGGFENCIGADDTLFPF